jgi:hypothetical protein
MATMASTIRIAINPKAIRMVFSSSCRRLVQLRRAT